MKGGHYCVLRRLLQEETWHVPQLPHLGCVHPKAFLDHPFARLLGCSDDSN